MGYDRPFQRLWDYYLAYCEGGFMERSVADVQFLFARNDSKFEHLRFGRSLLTAPPGRFRPDHEPYAAV